MNTTVKSLQDVYVELGGSLTDTYEEIANGVPVSDYVTNPDVIEAIAQIAGKTVELPKTTSADNGKLLVVNEDGDWDKGDAPEELPEVTASDNGSVLSVVDGAWAKGLKIKKKQVTVNGGSTVLNFKVNDSNSDIGKMVIVGYALTSESVALLPSSGSTVTLSTTNSSGMGTYGIGVSATLMGTQTTFPTGTYTLDVYYIEQE